MASIRNKKTQSAAPAAPAKVVEINFPRKVSFDNRPSLIGFFSATVEGYEVFGQLSLTQNEEEKFGVIFPQRSYEKDGKKQYSPYIHPVTKEDRQAILDAASELFTKIYEDDSFDGDDNHPLKVDPYVKDGVTLKWPHKREVENFKDLLGDVSFQTTRRMCLRDIELHKSKDGKYFVVFPARHKKQDDGSWKDYPHCGPASAETREAITAAAVEAFEKL